VAAVPAVVEVEAVALVAAMEEEEGEEEVALIL
jgi:hypothetical protein